MTTELRLDWALGDPSGFRVRDLPLRYGCSFFDDELSVGRAPDISFELYRLEDIFREELRDRRSDEEDSDDDDTGFESSLDTDLSFDIFGGRFLWTRIGCSWSLFEWLIGGAIGAHEASELIGFFIHVATLVVSSLLFFLLKSLLSRRLVCRKETGEDGSVASKPETSSCLNATHSSFTCFKTISNERNIEPLLASIWQLIDLIYVY